MTTVLITGITGFAGSNLVRHFHTMNDIRVIGHTRDKVRATQQFKNYAVSFIDDLSPEALTREGVNVVIHLAGIAHDLSNRYVEADYYRVNDQATRQLYDAFLSSSADRFIYLSSIKAVADVASEPVVETATPTPATPYGMSKRQAEDYIRQVSGGTTKKYYLLRPCMIHGPGNKGNLNLLYRYVRTGLPFPLGSFHNRRSFLGVENFNFIISQLIRGSAPSGIYHVADTGFLSTTGLVRTIAKAMKRNVPVWNLPESAVTLAFTLIGRKKMLTKLTEDMLVSNEKLLRELKVSLPNTIEEGIEQTIQSFHEQQ